MPSKYYILTSASYSEIANELDYSPVWNVSGSYCIIETQYNYVVNDFVIQFANANDCQNYIYHPDRINNWYEPDISEIP